MKIKIVLSLLSSNLISAMWFDKLSLLRLKDILLFDRKIEYQIPESKDLRIAHKIYFYFL